MVFSDVIEVYDECYKILFDFKTVLANLADLNSVFAEFNSTVFRCMFNKSYNDTAFLNKHYSLCEQRMNHILNSSRCINSFFYAKKVQLLDNLIKENSNINFIKNIGDRLVNSLNYLFDDIQNFNSSLDVNDRIEKLYKLMNTTKSTSSIIDSFFTHYNELVELQKDLEYTIDVPRENTEILTIHFYDKNISLDVMGNVLKSINNIYETLCNMATISTIDYKLIPIKIESGSMFQKMLGESKVIQALNKILSFGFKAAYRSYTVQGKLEEENLKINSVKELIASIKEVQDLGIDTATINEEIEKQLTVISKNLTNIIQSSTKVKINDELITLDREVVKLLEDKKIKLLTEDIISNEDINLQGNLN